jgi:protein SCO1/2
MRRSAAWLYGVLAGAALLVGGFSWYEREHLPEPASPQPLWPRLAAYPLTDEEGRPFALENLRRSVVILAFIYTRCPSVCPRLSSVMQELLSGVEVGAPVAALSISLDPERDTGAVLTTYAAAYAVAGRTWRYVRPQSQPYAFLMAREVFGVTATTLPGQAEILHNDAFFLIGCEGQVYGPYASTDLEKARKHLQKLISLCERSSSG